MPHSQPSECGSYIRNAKRNVEMPGTKTGMPKVGVFS